MAVEGYSLFCVFLIISEVEYVFIFILSGIFFILYVILYNSWLLMSIHWIIYFDYFL